MSKKNNISFDDSKYKIRSRSILGNPEVPSLIKFLVDKKIVKNENQAIIILIISILIIIGLSVYFINNSVKIEPAIISPELNKY